MIISIKKMFSQAFISLCITVLIIFLLIIYPKAATSGVSGGLMLCANILIPSLFPFLVLTAFLSMSNFGYYLAKPFEWIFSILFRIPKRAVFAVILSFIGGYPSGAVAIDKLCADGYISKKTAFRMMLFCSNAGPAFVISAVGSSMLNSTLAGVYIFVSLFVSNIFIGAFSVFFSKNETTSGIKKSGGKQRISEIFVAATANGCEVMLKICAFTVLFSCLLSLIKNIAPNSVFEFCSLILEVTNGSLAALSFKNTASLLCFVTGFGGLCVHFQIFSIAKSFKINILLFLLARAFSGALSAVICSILFYYFPIPINVFMTIAKPLPVMPSNILASVILLLMSVFILLMPKRKFIHRLNQING